MIVLKETGMIAEFFDRYGITRPANICQLFWMTSLVSAGFVLAGLAVGFYVMGAVMLFVPYYWHPTTIWFFIITISGLVLGVCYWIQRWIDDSQYREPKQWQKNLSEAYAGFKEKYCPLVSYKETEDAVKETKP